jgi:transposase
MLPSAVRIYLAVKPVDLRQSFDSLAEATQHVLCRDPFSGYLFVFRNKRGDRVKILCWERCGFVIWYKRLERGYFRWMPQASDGQPSLEISAPDLLLILEGIELAGAKRQRRYTRPL